MGFLNFADQLHMKPHQSLLIELLGNLECFMAVVGDHINFPYLGNYDGVEHGEPPRLSASLRDSDLAPGLSVGGEEQG